MKTKVFIIDDDLSFRALLSDTLSALGYEVSEAANAQSAQSKLESYEPDVILLDVMLPDMDGVSLCRTIRSNPKTAHIPILVISALSDANTLNDALLFGATDFVVKPVHYNELKTRIDRAAQLKNRKKAE